MKQTRAARVLNKCNFLKKRPRSQLNRRCRGMRARLREDVVVRRSRRDAGRVGSHQPARRVEACTHDENAVQKSSGGRRRSTNMSAFNSYTRYLYRLPKYERRQYELTRSFHSIRAAHHRGVSSGARTVGRCVHRQKWWQRARRARSYYTRASWTVLRWIGGPAYLFCAAREEGGQPPRSARRETLDIIDSVRSTQSAAQEA